MSNLLALLQNLPGKSRPVVRTCLYGLVASVAAVAFQVAINWIYRFCYQRPSTGSVWHFAWISLAVIVVASLIVGWLLNSSATAPRLARNRVAPGFVFT